MPCELHKARTRKERVDGVVRLKQCRRCPQALIVGSDVGSTMAGRTTHSKGQAMHIRPGEEFRCALLHRNQEMTPQASSPFPRCTGILPC